MNLSNYKYYLILPFFWLTVSLTIIFSLLSGADVNFEIQNTTGSLLRQFIYGIIIFLGLIPLYQERKNLLTFLKLNKLFVVLLVYTYFSVFWSKYPFISFKRYILLLGTFEMVCIIALSQKSLISSFRKAKGFEGNGAFFLGEKIFFKLFYYFILIMTLVSLFVIFFIPNIGIDFRYDGAWRGVMGHKNSFGMFSAFAAYFCWFIFIKKKYIQNNFLALALSAVNLIFVLKSRSSTSLISLILTVFIYYFFLLFKNQKVFLYLVCLVITAICGVKIIEDLFMSESLVEVILSLLGKDNTFTNRTDIWIAMLHEIKQHPILGCGYGGFWIGLEGGSWSINHKLNIILYQAHNGYIDVFNQLGFFGFCLFIIFLMSTFKKVIYLMKQNYHLGIFCMSLLLIILCSNISETSFLRNTHLYWFLLSSIQLLIVLKKKSVIG